MRSPGQGQFLLPAKLPDSQTKLGAHALRPGELYSLGTSSFCSPTATRNFPAQCSKAAPSAKKPVQLSFACIWARASRIASLSDQISSM